MAQHNLFGKEGEEFAMAYVRNTGYTILHTNWRYRSLELDIVAEKDNMLIIIEVKSRKSDHFEHPKEAVTRKKQRFIINATEAYIIEFDIKLEVRFDVITLIMRNGKFELEHIEDAFIPSWR